MFEKRLESDWIQGKVLRSQSLTSQKAIKGGGAEGQMAERSDGRKQETPERDVERWIMMMKKKEEGVGGGEVMIGQHPEANRSSSEAAEGRGWS